MFLITKYQKNQCWQKDMMLFVIAIFLDMLSKIEILSCIKFISIYKVFFCIALLVYTIIVNNIRNLLVR